MRERIAAAFAALVVLVSLVVLGPAPAQANVLYGCSDYAVCLYQWQNFGAGRWQSSLTNIWSPLHHAGCLTLAPATWSNGTPVSANSGSFVINTAGAWMNNDYWIGFYTGAGCTGSRDAYPLDYDYFNNWDSFYYHNVRSIGIWIVV